MPRTRAGLRHAVLEDPEVAAQVPLPSTPKGGGHRAPLGEISLNEQEAAKIQLEVDLDKPARKPEKKSRGAGRKKKNVKENFRPSSGPEVIEDDCESSASSAVEEACHELRSKAKDGTIGAFV